MKSLVFAIALAVGGAASVDAWACDCQKKEAQKEAKACDCAGQTCPGECPGMAQQAPQKDKSAKSDKRKR